MHKPIALETQSTTTATGFAALVALTPQARDALRQEYLVIDRLPFRVGRECRATRAGAPGSMERRHGLAPPLNDLYIVETDESNCVARQHFRIDQVDDGYVVVDAGSRAGTTVAGHSVATSGGRLPIRDHDLIIVGPSDSPFVFRFRCD